MLDTGQNPQLGFKPICESQLKSLDNFVSRMAQAMEEAQELLNLLVDTFSLAIGLQVVGHRGCDFNPKYFAESSHEV